MVICREMLFVLFSLTRARDGGVGIVAERGFLAVLFVLWTALTALSISN